jgi:hypothetical protein
MPLFHDRVAFGLMLNKCTKRALYNQAIQWEKVDFELGMMNKAGKPGGMIKKCDTGWKSATRQQSARGMIPAQDQDARWCVVDFTVHDAPDSFTEGHRDHADLFGRFMMCRYRVKILRHKKVIAVENDRAVHFNTAQRNHLPRVDACLLPEFSSGGFNGRFISVDAAADTFEPLSAERVPELPDQRDIIPLVDGEDADTGFHPDGGIPARGAVGTRHVVFTDFDEAVMMNKSC